MKTFLAPNGKYIVVPNGQVVTFGLNNEENKLIKDALPAKGYALFVANTPADLIAVSSTAIIINAAALDTDNREMILDYYMEIGSCIEETVFWIGYPKPPHPLRARFKCYEYFPQLALNLNYHLLTAQRKSKKKEIQLRDE